MKPITPEEAAAQKVKEFPAFVIAGVNKTIAKHFDRGSARFTQKEVIAAILAETGGTVSRKALFDNKWLDFEEIYREAGWSVVYDGPGYNESYEPTFTFRKADLTR